MTRLPYPPSACVILLLVFAGCSEPRCPRNLVQDRMICRRCPDGAFVKNNLCMFADGGVVGPMTEPEDEDAASEAGSETLDSGVVPPNPNDEGGVDGT